MKRDIYFDFADEVYKKKNKTIKKRTTSKDNIEVTWISLLEDDNEFHKKKGNYITLQLDEISSIDEESFIKAFKKELNKLIRLNNVANNGKVLVVGLGNDQYNSDSLGPKVIDSIFITSHITDRVDDIVRSVSSFKPGVMSKTGLESSNMVKALQDKEKFSLIIVIDSLATTSPSRLFKVIQMTDTGISPGSGVLNHRLPLDKETMGVPVICVGVATVLESAYLIYDYILKQELDISLNEIRESLEQEEFNYIITSKDIDQLIKTISYLISEGINYSLNPTYEELLRHN